MQEIIKTTFKLRRGLAETWTKKNPVLSAGEPGFELDTNLLKIGDGITDWNSLGYIGEQNIVSCSSHYSFPSFGKSNFLYKDETEKTLYQWNDSTLTYEKICSEGEIPDIKIINGGTANEY